MIQHPGQGIHARDQTSALSKFPLPKSNTIEGPHEVRTDSPDPQIVHWPERLPFACYWSRKRLKNNVVASRESTRMPATRLAGSRWRNDAPETTAERASLAPPRMTLRRLQ